MEFDNWLFTKDEGIAVVMINRPQFMNTLNRATVEELSQIIDLLEKDDEVKTVIITGAGNKSFIAGGDITYMQAMNSLESREFGMFGHRVLSKLEHLPKPVIAAINGFCLGGGCEVAMACDFRIASSKARFGQPEVKLGVIPGFGGTQRLPRLIGLGMAKQLLFSGDIIGAEEALRIGLVNQVVPEDELLDQVKGIAHRIMSGGMMAVSLCKLAVNEGMQTDIDRAMTIEAEIFGLCFSTWDQKEGMKAFAEKRSPEFKEK